jgi:hypothetical protein
MADLIPASRSRRIAANVVDGVLLSVAACTAGALDHFLGLSKNEDPRVRKLYSRLSEAAWDAYSIQRQRGNSLGFRVAGIDAVDAVTFKQLGFAEAVLRTALKRAPALLSTELFSAEAYRFRTATAALTADIKANPSPKTDTNAAVQKQLLAAVPMMGKSMLVMHATRKLLKPLRQRVGTKTVAVSRNQPQV